MQLQHMFQLGKRDFVSESSRNALKAKDCTGESVMNVYRYNTAAQNHKITRKVVDEASGTIGAAKMCTDELQQHKTLPGRCGSDVMSSSNFTRCFYT